MTIIALIIEAPGRALRRIISARSPFPASNAPAQELDWQEKVNFFWMDWKAIAITAAVVIPAQARPPRGRWPLGGGQRSVGVARFSCSIVAPSVRREGPLWPVDS